MKVHLFDRELDNKVPSLNKAKVHGFKMSACGYQREVVTTNKDEVTCKACLKKMRYLKSNKKSKWIIVWHMNNMSNNETFLEAVLNTKEEAYEYLSTNCAKKFGNNLVFSVLEIPIK